MFAPNDAAFVRTARDLGYRGGNELGAFTFLATALGSLGPLDQVLKTIIFYHAVPGKLGPIQVILQGSKPAGLTTVQGGSIRVRAFTLIDQDPHLPNPNLTLPINIQASNGVVHSIDRVLIPIDL